MSGRLRACVCVCACVFACAGLHTPHRLLTTDPIPTASIVENLSYAMDELLQESETARCIA